MEDHDLDAEQVQAQEQERPEQQEHLEQLEYPERLGYHLLACHRGHEWIHKH